MTGETTRVANGEEYAERLFARLFVAAGGVFWVIAAFAGPYLIGDMSLAESLRTAVSPFIATVVTLVVARYSEELAAVLLFAGASAVFVWGVLYQWDVSTWILMAAVLITPMVTAAVLFILAARAADERRDDSSASAWQLEDEGGAQPRSRVDFDDTSVRFNDLFGDRQPEPGSPRRGA